MNCRYLYLRHKWHKLMIFQNPLVGQAATLQLHFLPFVLLKGPEEPDKSLDKHITIEDNAEHDWDCDYPNEDYYGSSGNFFMFEYLPQILPKAGNDLITPPEAENINSSNSKSHPTHKTPLSIRSGYLSLLLFYFLSYYTPRTFFFFILRKSTIS